VQAIPNSEMTSRSDNATDSAEATRSIFLSVAETSADLYGANLLTALRGRRPERRCWGLTGPRTRAAGCETFHDMVGGAAMLFGAIARVPGALLMLERLKRKFRREPPAAAVLIDSPALHLPLARICRRMSIPVLYYVAPQTWAWKERRVAVIRENVDRLVAILPFEPEYFARHGITARFHGHPLFEELERTPPDEARVAAYRASGDPLIVLMPGSRRRVIEEVFPDQWRVAERLAREFRGARFLVAAADAEGEDRVRAIARRMDQSAAATLVDRITFDHRTRGEMLAAADLALVASGTATLEVAYHATPMIVMYNHGRWMLPLMEAGLGLAGGRLLRTTYLSLPNILAGRAIVPEFMPFYPSIEPIVACAANWLSDRAALRSKQRELAALVAPMVRADVSAAVAADLDSLIAAGGRSGREISPGSR